MGENKNKDRLGYAEKQRGASDSYEVRIGRKFSGGIGYILENRTYTI